MSMRKWTVRFHKMWELLRNSKLLKKNCAPRVCMYVCTYVCVCIYINKYIYIQYILYIYTHTHIYKLTPWCRVLLERLTGLQLVKKFPAFYVTRRFITALTSVRHLSLTWASPIQSTYPPPTSWRSILILFTHLRLGLPSYIYIYIYSKFTSKLTGTDHVHKDTPFCAHVHSNSSNTYRDVKTIQSNFCKKKKMTPTGYILSGCVLSYWHRKLSTVTVRWTVNSELARVLKGAVEAYLVITIAAFAHTEENNEEYQVDSRLSQDLNTRHSDNNVQHADHSGAKFDDNRWLKCTRRSKYKVKQNIANYCLDAVYLGALCAVRQDRKRHTAALTNTNDTRQCYQTQTTLLKRKRQFIQTLQTSTQLNMGEAGEVS